MQPVNAALPFKKIVSGILLCFLSFGAPAQPNLPDTAVYSADWLPVYPQVNVNGNVSDGLFEFISHKESLLVAKETLTALGINIPPDLLQQAQTISPPPSSDAGTPSESLYVLESIPQLETYYNAPAQTLALTAPLAWLNLPTTRIGNRQEQAYSITGSGFAGVLNYDYNATHNHDGSTGQGLLTEARITTPAGYLSHNQLWSRHKPQTGRSLSNNVRLDTYWRTVQAEKGLVLTAGDVLTSQLGGAGSSRIGGIRLERTYSVQPWRNTAPLFSYLGESTLPGTVDLYLNGVKQYSRDIAAGKYEITLPPTISGSGLAQVVATDVLGRTVVVDMPLYGGSGLLAEGLSEWSVEAGYLRKNYGLSSNSYDRNPVGSGTWRYGITNALTAQLHAEAGRSYNQLGAASSAVLGTLGQLNLSHAQSRFQSQKGSQSSAFFSTQKGSWSFGAGWSRTEAGFANLNAVLDPAPYLSETDSVRTASSSLSWHNKHLGTFALSYLHSKKGQEQPDKVGALNWNRNFGRHASVFLNGTRNFNDGRQYSIYGGVSLSFNKGYFGTLSSQRDNDGSNSHRLSLNKSSAGLGSPSWGIGWQQQSGGHGKGRLNGHIDNDTRYGSMHGSVYRSQNGTNWNAGWSGGLVWMNGGLFAGRTIDNSFAVVSTDGIAGVPVSLFNTKVGETNRKGLLLVPNLSAYQQNTLDIDISEQPSDIHAERARIQAVPSERSGVNVNFRLNRMRAASVTLKNGSGEFVESGSTVLLSDGTATAVVGFDGQTFIDNLASGQNRFTVILPENGGTCRFSIDYQAERHNGNLPDLGEILCIEE